MKSKDQPENELAIQTLCQKLKPLNEAEVRKVLQAVLHCVRDRLSPEDSAHFSKTIPPTYRGAYNENWNRQVPTRSAAGFLEDVGKRLGSSSRKSLKQEVHEVLKHIHDWLRTTELKNLPVIQEAMREFDQAGI
jgi:uncharacterized protein (DUF2267 family)